MRGTLDSAISLHAHEIDMSTSFMIVLQGNTTCSSCYQDAVFVHNMVLHSPLSLYAVEGSKKKKGSLD